MNIAKIEEYITKMMFYHDIPGLCLGIGNNDILEYNQGFGYKNIETKEKLEKDTIFHMASITKLFVGTALMQLMERKLVDIKKPVIEYIPYFQLEDIRYKDITVEHILTHTSGLPNCDDFQWDEPQYDEDALKRYVKSLTAVRLLGEPGEKFSYSDIGYEVLGDLISVVSGMSFEDYIDENIFKPLNMKHSSLLTFQRNQEDIASPHIKNEEKKVVVSKVFPYNRIHAPSSTLTTNVEDIHIWASVNLNRGEYNGVRILKDQTYDKMWKPMVSINEKEQMCLSWFTRQHRGFRVMGHEGSDIGFRSSFAIIPEEKMFVSLHVNIQTAPTRRIQKGILDILYGYEPEIR